MDRTEYRVLACWNETALLKRRAKITSLLVRNDRAWIVMRRQVFAHDLVKRNSVWAGDLNGSIQRCGDRDFGQISGKVVGKNGLKQHRGQVNGLPAGRLISNAPHELKKLRRAGNCVRNR